MMRASLIICCCLVAVAHARGDEIGYAGEAYKQLDTYEAHVLSKADKSFAAGKYRLAAREYDSFILEFPRSAAVPYALLRKGRSMQHDSKRFEAMKEYQEVIDYFPDVVRYAAAARYYIGECHQQNGDIEKMLLAWAEMIDDADYRKHPFAGNALKVLADNLMKQQKIDKAIEYYTLVITDFRGNTPRESMEAAINAVLYHYIRRQPDAAAVATFVKQAGGLEWQRKVTQPADPDNDLTYWRQLIKMIDARADFSEFQQAEKKQFYGYWAKAMAGKFPDDDGFQLRQAAYYFAEHGDRNQYRQRLDQIYQARLTPENTAARTIGWLKVYRGDVEKIQAYYASLDSAKLTPELSLRLIQTLQDIGQTKLIDQAYANFPADQAGFSVTWALAQYLYQFVRNRQMARHCYDRIDFSEVSDQTKVQLANWLWNYDEERVMTTCGLMDDKPLADYQRLRYFHWRQNHKLGIEPGLNATKDERFAKQAWQMVGDLYGFGRQWSEAIQAYRNWDSPPASAYRIAECYSSMGKLDQAVQQLREIEGFFPREGARAAYRIAELYRHAGKLKEEEATLHHIMKKYPGSGESHAAHERMEAMGWRISGGLDER